MLRTKVAFYTGRPVQGTYSMHDTLKMNHLGSHSHKLRSNAIINMSSSSVKYKAWQTGGSRTGFCTSANHLHCFLGACIQVCLGLLEPPVRPQLCSFTAMLAPKTSDLPIYLSVLRSLQSVIAVLNHHIPYLFATIDCFGYNTKLAKRT